MSSTATAPSKATSWLTRAGQIAGRVLHVVGSAAGKVADIAKPVLIALFPSLAPEVNASVSLIDNIALEAQAVEATAAAAGTAAGTGAQKLEAAIANVGPAIDQWVVAKFPGATQVSAAAKAGLINAVVAIMNEVQGGTVSAV